jgi:protein-S-isoprenylcysteine O-methyltransferase Ste14
MNNVLSRRSSVGLSYWLPTLVLIVMWLFLAYGNLVHWRATGDPPGLGFLILELMTVVLFVARRQPIEVSNSAFTRLATGIGCFVSLLMRPAHNPIAELGLFLELLQLVGVAIAAAGLCSLGRSFGLVAANRGIRTHGLYRFVRHPVYGGHIIIHSAFLLANPSLYNVGIFSMVWLFQLVRIGQDEKLLSSDPSYVRYMEKVRYRLIPLLY